MRCKKHGGFTIYPPGYYPHSRHTLAPVDMEGDPLVESDDGRSLLTGTLFEAASDAAHGIQWQIESNDGLFKPRFSTQLRHIQRAAILLGIAPDTEPYLREEIAHILSVPGQILNDCSNQIHLSICEYQRNGKEICHILQCIPAEMLFERFAETGAGAGLWATPLFFTNNILQQSPFHRVRMRGS